MLWSFACTVLVLFFTSVSHCNISTPYVVPNEYQFNKTIIKGYTLYWTSLYSQNLIEFGIVAETTGWVALGFGATPDGMTNADVIIGYFDKNSNKIVVRDAFLNELGRPPIWDINQVTPGTDDIISSNGGILDGTTHIKFIRKLNVTDKWDNSITNSDIRVSVAFNSISTDTSSPHTNQGKTMINFLAINPSLKPKFQPIRFHLYITGMLITITIILGLLTSDVLLPSRFYAARRGILHLLFHKKLFQYNDMKWLDHIADLTLGELYFILVYLTICVVWFLQEYIGAIRWGEPSPLGRAFAWITIVNLSFILLPVMRNSVWFYIFGISYEKAIRFHRNIGRFNLISIILHGIFMTVEYGPAQLIVFDRVTGKYTLAGTVSWLLLGIAFSLGYEPIRRRIWEWFVAIHVIFGFLSFILIIIHAKVNQTVPFISFGIILYIIDLILRFIFSVCFPAKLLDVEYIEKCNVTKLTIFKKNWRAYKPGQHVYVWLGALSYTEWHPFSIAAINSDGSFTIYAKNIGTNSIKISGKKWTMKLAEWSRDVDSNSALKTSIRIEGPYGKDLSRSNERYDAVVLIAGGIGITALYETFRSFNRQNKKVFMVWSTGTRDMWKLFPELILEETNFGNCCDIRFYITREDGVDENALTNGINVYNRRPNFNDILEEISGHMKSGYISVCICGPEEMSRDVRKACWNESKDGIIFHFHEEVFSAELESTSRDHSANFIVHFLPNIFSKLVPIFFAYIVKEPSLLIAVMEKGCHSVYERAPSQT